MPFAPGNNANPTGRPVGAKGIITTKIFADALKNVETKTGINILEYYINKALTNDKILISLMRKLLPDLSSNEEMHGEELWKSIKVLVDRRFNPPMDVDGIAESAGNSEPDPTVPKES